MISIYDKAGEVYPLAGYEDFCITHKLDGCDTMSFILNMKNEQYPLLQEEGHVDTDDNRWLIKKIDDDKIDCELDFDFLKGRLYFAYKSETKLLSEVLARHLPSDWTVLGASQSVIRRSISFDACTDFDVIYECIDTYKVRFMWNMKKKTLTVVVPENVASSGEYLTTELNLRSLSFKGDTTEFATRLYCVGKDGMTIEEAQVDDGAGGKKRYGLPYVEDRSYADKVICAYWEDDRYTDPTSMYNDGMEKLKVLANPVRSYECEVLNLAKMAPEEYSFLAFQMHRKLTLVDTDRGVKVEHQIVEHQEYPEESDRDKVTLSCVPDTIQAKLKDAIKSAVSGYSTVVDQKVEAAQALLDSKIMMATAMLTGAFGNYPYSQNGELFMMDNPDPQAAQVVWRWNINGFGKSSTGIDGPYTTAMTWNDEFITGVITAMAINAAIVKTGILQSTDGETFYLDLDKGILRMKASALTVAGEGGKDIPITDSVTSSVAQYYLSDSRTELAGGEWSDKTPAWVPGKYIWTRSLVTHANGITEYSPSEAGVCITGNDGADGRGVLSSVVTYQASTSGTTPPGGTWGSDVPDVPAGQYLWTKTVITYTDNDSTTLYTVSRIGGDGTPGKDGEAGVGVADIKNFYMASASGSGVTVDTPGWSQDVQSVSAGKPYLWNYEVTSYTDGSSTTVEPHVVGTYGRDGTNGTAGKGISDITEHYLATTAASGVMTNTPGWTEQLQQTDTSKRYLWNYETIAYSDGSSSTVAPRIIGTHGATGATGEAGVGIESIVAEYIRSPSYEYAEEDPEAKWSTTVPEFIEGRYIWTRQKITYTDGTVSYEGEYCLTKTVGDIADDRVEKLNDLLDMEEIARRLTDDWKNEGFFLEDGKLYINASMIKAGILDLALLRLVGDRGGLMEGFGSTSKGETKGILMFGPNGLDAEGNAIPPYTLLTDAGWRAQLDDLVSVYVSMFTNGRGLGVVGDARIYKTSEGTRGRLTVEGSLTAESDFVVDDVVYIGKGDEMDRYICLGRNDDGYLYFARLTADGLLTIGNGTHARGTFINGKSVYINRTGADTIIRGRVDFSQADSVSGLGGSSMRELWSGTLTSGSASWSSGGYGWYVVIVKPGSSSSQVSVVVPAGQLGERFQGADNECYTSFYLYERSITFNASNSNGQIKAVYGIS